MNPTLLKVIQEGLVAVSLVAIKAVLEDPDVKSLPADHIVPFGCDCDHCRS